MRVSKNALAAALTAFLLTSSVAGAVDNVIVGNTEAPNAVTDTTDSTVVGIDNEVSKEKDDVIVGKKNTIEDSEDVRVVGKGNTVTNSDRQNVFGDNNSITNRDAGTVSGYHGIARNGTSDLVIGMGNKIEGNDTYMTGHESLTVIGNNNETVNPTSGIVIGDNQTFGTIKESVIIGSMTPEEKASGKREQGGGSVVVGYNAQSGRGLNVAVGHSALALGHEGTVTGHNSVIEGNDNSFPNIWSSIYGVNNKITSNGNTSNGIAGSIIGTWNKLDNADNSMIFGSGNILSHATVDMSSGLEGTFGQGAMTELLFRSGYQEGYSDQAAKVMGDFANTSGSVLIAGNGNRSDYARRSQIVGTGNVLNGTANGTSANNTMAGFQNTGTNVNRVAVVGTGNKISDGTSDVVIGDYHEMSGGTNNVILGAMATKEDVVSKTYTPSLGNSSGTPGGYTGRPIPYNVRATVPTKTHTANISNAVMLGYNTDVQKNGGVALGSESVSSVDAGVYGYSPDTNQNIQNDTEIANLTGKTARLAQLNGDLPGLSSAYTAKKADYEGKVNDFLAKSAAYTQAYQTYHSYEHSGDQYDLARKKEMDDAKTVMDTAQTAMNAAKTDYTDAETKYNSALGERNLIIGTWKATAAAVSVGDVSRGITRQITGVAAGTQDTDAVNVAQLKTVNTKYDTKLSRGFIIKKGGEAVGETISLNGDTAPEITFDVAEANKGLTVDRDGKTIKYGIDGSKIDLNGNDTIPGWTLEVGVKPGIPTNTGSAEGNKKVIKPNDTVTLRADNGIRLKQENGVVDIGLKYMAVDTKWTNINDAAATNGGMAIGANSNADGETSVALGWGSNISASNYAAALSPFSSAVNSEYGLAMGTKAAVKTSPYGMAMGALSSVDDSEYGAAIGANSTIVNSNYGVVIGTSATVKDADNAVAIGVSSSAAVKNGVAIGAFSKADTAAGVSGYDPSTKAASTDTSAAWRSTVSAASVGDKTKGYTRQITNVAAGTQDIDAVNVAQLKKVQAAADAAKTHYYSVEDKGYHAGNYNNDGAKGGMALAAGAGAAANGTASAVTGAFSRVDGNGINGFTSGFQGATSSVYGTFNVVGAKSGVDFDGVANSIIGVANKTENANASLIFGAGNKVTNSYRPVNGFNAGPLSNALQKAINTGDTDDMINALGDLVKDSGGSVLAIGGANIADYAQLSKLVGVGNKLIGTAGHESKYNMIDGYLNTGKNINHVSVIGSENTVEDTDDALVLGNKRKLSGAGGSIILGSGDNPITTNVSDVVSIGHNANVTAAGGVALGSSSVASVDKGVIGYDASGTDHSNDTTGVWKSTAAAVSVGDATGNTKVTRQITGVAAGAADTDAVNVAQLKKAVAGAADGNDTLVSGSNGLSLSGKTLSMSVKDTAGNEVKGSVDLSAIAGQIDTNTTYTMSGTQNADNTTTITLKGSDGKENKVTVATKDTKNTVKAGENVTLATAANTFGGTEYTVNVKADGKVENGNTKIVSGNTVYHETHVKNDGNYVKKENSAGDNLTILDKQVGKNTTNITNLGNTINNLNGKLGTLDNRISKVGAGAAALAALHPLDFDPHDKWDIAAGFGNYCNASAAAVGLFYRPNERTMMSLGWTMGDDRNMINAGISVKLGRGDVYTRYSKVEMANRIEAQNKRINDMESELEELKAQIAALAAKK
ncbi:YadA-like family protein [Dialister invisus]|uniref:YadA-like family protein n=1 Tax=Dialister invisus TaxID=218538 RepID=UPI00399A2F1B